MTKRIFRSIFAVAAVVLLLSLGVVLGVLYDHFSDVQWQQLNSDLELTRLGLESSGEDYLGSITAEDFRITWIDPSGTVISIQKRMLLTWITMPSVRRSWKPLPMEKAQASATPIP